MIIERTYRGLVYGAEEYAFDTDHGSMLTTFRTIPRMYYIVLLGVDQGHQRRGIGKSLLRAGLAHAEELDASRIHSKIVSRECLDAMRSVFSDAVTVEQLGDYRDKEDYPKHATSATLHYEL